MDSSGRAGVTAYPVSRYLIQFGAEEEPKPVTIAEPFVDVLQPLSAKPDEAHETQAALLEAAREEGRIEARAIAQAQYEATLANMKLAYENHLGEERNAWVADESAKFGAALTDAVAQLESRLADSIDAILRPFLIESLRRQMIDELVNDVNVLLAGESPVIEISGASDILVALQEKLASSQVAIDYKPNDSIDVRIVAHHTIIESQLRAWIERFDLSKEQN
jgi:hypothetical protein